MPFLFVGVVFLQVHLPHEACPGPVAISLLLLPPPRNVFYKKVKTRPQTPSIARQFIISKNMFEFGPLLLNKDPAGEESRAG